MDTRQRLIDWLYNREKFLDPYYSLLLNYMLGQEFISPPLVMLNRDENDCLWVGNKTSCYPDILYCRLDQLSDYIAAMITNKEELLYLEDLINEIPKRFELIEK